MGALGPIAAIASIAGSAASLFGGNKKPPPAPKAPDLPPPPQRDVLGETAAVTRVMRRKAGSSRASSIKTGPSGLTQPADVERATLLGG